MLAICTIDKPVVFKALKTSSRAESISQGVKPGAKTRYKKPATSSKQHSVSSKEAIKGGSSRAPTGSKTGHSKRRKVSISAMDSNPSQPSVSTPVDTKMHKEDQQATGGPTSLGVTSEERAHPQLSSEKGASSTPIHGDKDEASIAIHGDKEEASSTIKLEDLAKLVSQIQPSFKDLDLPKDYPVIIVDESDEDEPNAKTKDTSLELEKNKAEAEAALLKAQPSFLNVEQLNELLVKSLQTGFSKILSSHDFSSSLPTELKDLPSKIKELTEKIKGLKTQVRELEIELPKELKEIPTKLEDFTKTVTSLKSQVAELKTLQWELPKEFISLLEKVESAQAKLKTLDALPSLLLNVTKALNRVYLYKS
ncbi:hypothetical protein Tco_1380584 [Tanacetum coccineum]